MVKQIGNLLIKIVILTIIFQMICIPISNANSWTSILETGDDFIDGGKQQANSNNGDAGVDQDELDVTISQIYNILLALGVVLSVIIGAMLGIKFMIGSVDEQAKTKEMLAPYVTGCIVVFGAFGIWKLMMTLLGSI